MTARRSRWGSGSHSASEIGGRSCRVKETDAQDMALVRSIGALCCLAGAAWAQARLDMSNAGSRQAVAAFEAFIHDKAKIEGLICRVHTTAPRLGFDLNLWSGFDLTLPAKQFTRGRRNRLTILVRVESLDPPRPPVFLGRREIIPRFPPNADIRKIDLTLGGGFLVGPGTYRVHLLVADLQQRGMLHSWTVKARAPRGTTLRLAPGEADDGSAVFGHRRTPLVTVPRVATVLINAYPVWRRRSPTRLTWPDQHTLLDILHAVVEAGGFSTVRLVVFDLSRRKVVFESEDFSRTAYRDLLEALSSVDLATIDYDTLAHGPTEWQFLTSLAQRESQRSELSRALIYISSATTPPARPGPRLDSLREALPPSFCFSLLPTPVPEDPVSDFVHALHGRILPIQNAGWLGPALHKMADDLNSAQP
jgi:hypothetical protein